MNVFVPRDYHELAKSALPDFDGKLSLNQPSGHFFYDPWSILPEYKDTIWESILKTLPFCVGEARLIKMEIEKCYTKHADVDNRYHFSLTNDDAYLIDADNKVMHCLENGTWYYMDASRAHSAVNLGCNDRVSLVVRELLPRCILTDPKHVEITVDTDIYNHRFLFDEIYSGFLNKCQTQRLLSNFNVVNNQVSFDIDRRINIPNHSGFKIKEYD